MYDYNDVHYRLNLAKLPNNHHYPTLMPVKTSSPERPQLALLLFG